MNKKAQFIPILVVFLILVLSTFVFVMVNKNETLKSIKINYEATSTFNLYGLAEKNKYYLEKAGELAKEDALKKLNKNAGHLPGDCSKTLNGKILWNTCRPLNLKEDFIKLFKEKLNKYIRDQNQPIGNLNLLNNGEINKLESEIILKTEDLEVNFKNVTYLAEDSNEKRIFTITHTFNPSFSLNAPDFPNYGDICNLLTECNLGPKISPKEIDFCINSLEELKGIKISRNNNLIDISSKNFDFSVDLKQKIDCRKKI